MNYQYRKKPIVIEAFQMTRARRAENAIWPEWLHRAWQQDISERGAVGPVNYPASDGTDNLCVHTLEGVMRIEWGDWIIRGVKGEVYPCKPDVFAATYDLADSGAAYADITFAITLWRDALAGYQGGDTESTPSNERAIGIVRAGVERIRAERDEAREWVRKLQKTTQTLTCVYCGQEYPPGSPAHGSEVLTAHIKVCEKHPMREVERKLAEAAKHHDAVMERSVLAMHIAEGEPGWENALIDCPMLGAVFKLRQELVTARETNRRLNARCQLAEKALPDWKNIEMRKFVSGNLGRALLAYALSCAQEQLAEVMDELGRIRNSAGEQVMVCTAEGHSECVHRANAIIGALKRQMNGEPKKPLLRLEKKDDGIWLHVRPTGGASACINVTPTHRDGIVMTALERAIEEGA